VSLVRAQRTLSLFASVISTILLAACGGVRDGQIPASAPTVTSFTANPATINAGQSSTLSWSATNATGVTIDGISGALPASGSQTVTPAATTTYTLHASGAGGSTTATTIVTVTAAVSAPAVTSFTATPSTSTPGAQVTLAWTTTDATSVSIDQGVGTNLPATGSIAVTPAATTTYTLTATGPGGSTTGAATVTVGNTNAQGLQKLNHIVVMYQENRGFDHYFGRLNEYRATLGLPPDVDGMPANASNPNFDNTGVITAFKLKSACMDNPTPSWNESHVQRNRFHPACTMDGFVRTAASYVRNRKGVDTEGIRVMGYYDQDALPYYYFMATQFATSNRFFSPLMARTQPNLLYSFAATSAGYIYAPVAGDPPLTQKTIFQLLEENGISWKIYSDDPDNTLFFTFQFGRDHRDKVVLLDQYQKDIDNGTLPQVAYIAAPSHSGLDEHPGPDLPSTWMPGDPTTTGTHIQQGARFVSTLINKLINSPYWQDSVFILTFDEGGGFFDHVPPAEMPPPDDIPPRFRTDPVTGESTDTPGDFHLSGFRVPLLVISPFTKKNYVSNTPMDYTAVLKLIELRWNLPSLTRRDAAQPSMEEFFDFVNPPWLTPPANIPTQPTNMHCDRAQLQ
jgi:phospholipase C